MSNPFTSWWLHQYGSNLWPCHLQSCQLASLEDPREEGFSASWTLFIRKQSAALDSIDRSYQSSTAKGWTYTNRNDMSSFSYLAVATPKRIADSWNLSNWFNMEIRWLLTPQMMIWSSSMTCNCAPSLTLCIWVCGQPGICVRNRINTEVFSHQFQIILKPLTLNCSVIALSKRE